ncbi:MAG: glycosyltransferase [Bacteroidales bacterium]|nr:glycosyltransferase [Bacteroidales bacterium]
MANRLFVLCDYPFPEGMAPTTRILAYAKGLNSNNCKCEVLTFTPLPRVIKKSSLQGIIDGVIYYRSHAYNPNGNKLYRVFIDLKLFRIKAISLLIKERRKEKIDVILISFDNPTHLIFFVPILIILGFKLAFISDEFPPEIRKLRTKISFFNKLFYILVHKAFLFRITMTKALKEYYNKEFGEKPTHILNTIVDIDRFTTNNIKTRNSKLNKTERIKLCYMGNMELEKDNIDNIIKAIDLLRWKFPNLLLHLYGTPNEKARTIIENLIANYELENHVQYKGRILFNEVPDVLKKYDVLVTSQPKTIRAIGGFPTKLGEYLMTGIPTIATKVGEINDHVKDGVHIYLVEPDDPVAYATRIEDILDNYNQAIEIAMTARDYVKCNFAANKVTKEMVSFIRQNVNRTNTHY